MQIGESTNRQADLEVEDDSGTSAPGRRATEMDGAAKWAKRQSGTRTRGIKEKGRRKRTNEGKRQTIEFSLKGRVRTDARESIRKRHEPPLDDAFRRHIYGALLRSRGN